VRIVAARVPQPVNLDAGHGARGAAAPPLAHADVGAGLALHDDAVGCCCVEHGVVVVGEEGVVVAWADCGGGGCEEGEDEGEG
jgi:hypothetical protein